MLPSFLAHKLAAPIAAGLLLLSVIGNAILGVNLWAERRHSGKLTDRVVALAGDLRTSRANAATLEGALRGQNAAVDRIKTEAELAAAKAKLAQEQASREAGRYRAAAAALAKAKPGADVCASASQLIRDTLETERSQ